MPGKVVEAHLAEELPRIYARESAAVVVFVSAAAALPALPDSAEGSLPLTGEGHKPAFDRGLYRDFSFSCSISPISDGLVLDAGRGTGRYGGYRTRPVTGAAGRQLDAPQGFRPKGATKAAARQRRCPRNDPGCLRRVTLAVHLPFD